MKRLSSFLFILFTIFCLASSLFAENNGVADKCRNQTAATALELAQVVAPEKGYAHVDFIESALRTVESIDAREAVSELKLEKFAREKSGRRR